MIFFFYTHDVPIFATFFGENILKTIGPRNQSNNFRVLYGACSVFHFNPTTTNNFNAKVEDYNQFDHIGRYSAGRVWLISDFMSECTSWSAENLAHKNWCTKIVCNHFIDTKRMNGGILQTMAWLAFSSARHCCLLKRKSNSAFVFVSVFCRWRNRSHVLLYLWLGTCSQSFVRQLLFREKNPFSFFCWCRCIKNCVYVHTFNLVFFRQKTLIDIFCSCSI
jgi:hypothetical protein